MESIAPVVRARVVVFLMILMLASTGCVSLRRAPMQVPGGIQPLTDPATRIEGYKKLFPPMPVLKTGAGNISASGGLSGKQSLRFIFLGADRQNLRLNTFFQTEPIFDVVVHDGVMTAVFYKNKAVFEGQVGDGASPFSKLFGVEPVDLIPIFEIGQAIAAGSFEAKGSERKPALVPTDAGKNSGLQKIELDPATGLPRNATWRRPVPRRWWQLRSSARWEVTYLAWDVFKDDRMPNEPARLMPRTFKIVGNRPHITLKIELPNSPDADPPQTGYRFSTTLPRNVFVTDFNFPHYPLDKLEDFLKQ